MLKWRMLILLIVGVCGAIGGPPAARAATCFGSGCNGQDATTTGCADDAYTVSSSQIRDSGGGLLGTIEYRWSPTCEAGYGRTTLSSDFESAARISAYISTGGTVYPSGLGRNLATITSPLLGAPQEDLAACGLIMLYWPANRDQYGDLTGLFEGDACAS